MTLYSLSKHQLVSFLISNMFDRIPRMCAKSDELTIAYKKCRDRVLTAEYNYETLPHGSYLWLKVKRVIDLLIFFKLVQK